MPGIDRYGENTSPRVALMRAGRCALTLRIAGFPPVTEQIADRITRSAVTILEEPAKRIMASGRMQIDHQPVPVTRDGR